jgi:hypothetical protein
MVAWLYDFRKNIKEMKGVEEEVFHSTVTRK